MVGKYGVFVFINLKNHVSIRAENYIVGKDTIIHSIQPLQSE